MAVSSRLYGNVNPIFTLKLGAAAAVQYDDLKEWEVEFEDADGDDLTFAEAAAGATSTVTVSGTALVSYDSGALFAFLMDNPNADVVLKLGPWGNATATPTKPHFTATFNTGNQPGFSAEAALRKDSSGAEFEFELVAKNTVFTKVVA